MSGLRERKKAQREQRILDAAEKLIAKHGFVATTMEQIAARADVGVGTVYNYFKSKNELLVALLARDTDRIIEKGELIVKKPPKNPVAAFSKLFAGYTRDFFGDYDKAVMRDICAVAFVQFPAMGDDMLQQDLRIIQQILDLLLVYEKKGLLQRDAANQLGAALLYEVFSMQFLSYVCIQDMTEQFYNMATEAKLKLVFHGFLK